MIWPTNPPDDDDDFGPPFDDDEPTMEAEHERWLASLEAMRMDGYPEHLDEHDCRQAQVDCFWCGGDGEDRIGLAFAYEEGDRACPYCGGRGVIAEDVE